MEKQYKIKDIYENYLKQKDLSRVFTITFFIYLFLILLIILSGDFSLKFFLFSLIYFVLVGIGLLGRYYTISSPDNTIILLKENHIIRKGKGLRTVKMNFEDIADFRRVKYGIILFDDKISSKLKYHFYGHAITQDSGILFIPETIEGYEEIKEYIMNKIN
ncbi:hypothetical protein MATR_31070 [Marivirga tractuosa]|uniref:Uncharacterized protein n=1 Tax=Marivirga tractuosa (strain ATCC 23168 / DSM 4126 / NBRC 15989 / NCIMB 1408 / VKM B-1430 / H-43) TaxID=643867 RepID=E4TU22_MARTH|nr:hypothetical protein [Marivirga tractuosa]ADR23044.1 hypothetical protein Ftrac_3068 [Marivirga tractuosa DSM 4126]BDD16282.1 hypothetical protein MATR_31070 [Marivirga tractuosa]